MQTSSGFDFKWWRHRKSPGGYFQWRHRKSKMADELQFQFQTSPKWVVSLCCVMTMHASWSKSDGMFWPSYDSCMTPVWSSVWPSYHPLEVLIVGKWCQSIPLIFLFLFQSFSCSPGSSSGRNPKVSFSHDVYDDHDDNYHYLTFHADEFRFRFQMMTS